MNLKTEFTEPECEWFRAACNFTPEERKIFDILVKDNSIVFVSMKLGMSTSTVSRKIKNIKRKNPEGTLTERHPRNRVSFFMPILIEN